MVKLRRNGKKDAQVIAGKKDAQVIAGKKDAQAIDGKKDTQAIDDKKDAQGECGATALQEGLRSREVAL